MGVGNLETLDRADEPDIQQAQAAEGLQYTRSDGTVETASSVEEARAMCPVLGGMSLEAANVLLSLQLDEPKVETHIDSSEDHQTVSHFEAALSAAAEARKEHGEVKTSRSTTNIGHVTSRLETIVETEERLHVVQEEVHVNAPDVSAVVLMDASDNSSRTSDEVRPSRHTNIDEVSPEHVAAAIVQAEAVDMDVEQPGHVTQFNPKTRPNPTVPTVSVISPTSGSVTRSENSGASVTEIMRTDPTGHDKESSSTETDKTVTLESTNSIVPSKTELVVLPLHMDETGVEADLSMLQGEGEEYRKGEESLMTTAVGMPLTGEKPGFPEAEVVDEKFETLQDTREVLVSEARSGERIPGQQPIEVVQAIQHAATASAEALSPLAETVSTMVARGSVSHERTSLQDLARSVERVIEDLADGSDENNDFDRIEVAMIDACQKLFDELGIDVSEDEVTEYARQLISSALTIKHGSPKQMDVYDEGMHERKSSRVPDVWLRIANAAHLDGIGYDLIGRYAVFRSIA